MISPQLEHLFRSLESRPPRTNWSTYEGPRFSTNKITISVGSFYERLRYAVDYQEEHMLRRAAIERIIRRLIRFTSFEGCGMRMLEELVLARYIENETIPESFADDIQRIMDTYRRFERAIPTETDIIWSYAAIEIEHLLFPTDIDERTFTVVFQTVVTYFKPKEPELMSEEAFNLRLYIACRRVFLRESHAVLNYSLFTMMVPEWRSGTALDDATLSNIGVHFEKLQGEIQALMTDPTHWKIAGRLKNESIYFALINDIVRRFGPEAESVLGDFQRLSQAVNDTLMRTYQTHKEKIKQSGTRAVIYVLITKMIVGLAVELPYEIFILDEVNYVALGINILLFPILLLFMTKTVHYPGETNTEEVKQKLSEFVEGKEQSTQYITIKRKTAVQLFGHFLFATTFFAFTFGIIVYMLGEYLHFNPASIVLFLIFLCIVTYMGLRIRNKAQEWALEKDDDSFGGIIWFLFTLPITRTGRWLSEKLSSVNIFVFFMDFILETPFKMLLGSFDSFISYMKETRRDGM